MKSIFPDEAERKDVQSKYFEWKQLRQDRGRELVNRLKSQNSVTSNKSDSMGKIKKKIRGSEATNTFVKPKQS